MAWNASTGEDRYRRGIYTYLKRTSPYPGLTTFDAPTSELTCPKRPRSNTPLQALLLMNETQYVECARALAERTLREAGANPEERIAFLFRLAAGEARRLDGLGQDVLVGRMHPARAAVHRQVRPR